MGIRSYHYFEWHHIYRKNKRTTNVKTLDKYPYQLMVMDQPHFYLAGVWKCRADRDTGEMIGTLAMVTTAAIRLLARFIIPKRMCTILLVKV